MNDDWIVVSEMCFCVDMFFIIVCIGYVMLLSFVVLR